ncbi:hypothetical protein BRADI_1g39097v3 [Brachypodium distachyon]|uniref:DUF538 family protein n=1 Tax=Brachypodium distachyon TaxID=15368 RepID=A0A2K2DNJ5_BRADI|nr:hypothetical protein BRADI_1g39097v3 [Brachypodium distachyon]
MGNLKECSGRRLDVNRSGAEVFTELCEVKAREFLVELGLPDGVLPLPSVEEVGYNRATGFVWLRQGQSGGLTHTFDAIGKQVWYATEVTAMVERGRMHSMNGVKSKEMLIWVTISDIVVSPSGTKIVFRTPAGLGRAFPVSAFQLNPPAPEGEAKVSEEDAAAAATTN